MTFAAIAAQANSTAISTFGIAVDYQVGTASRRINAAPGDIIEQARETGRGIELVKTCQWLVAEADLKDLPTKRRGHKIVRTAQPDEAWIVESSQPDLVGGITLSTVLSTLGTAGAQGAERLS